MTIRVHKLAREADLALSPKLFVIRYALIIVCAIVFVAPGFAGLARDVWSTEQGAQGPIILVSGLWLLWHEAQKRRVTATRPSILAIVPLLMLGGATMVYASIINKLWLEWAATYAVLIVVFGAMTNLIYVRALWFPLFYLGFLIPPPSGIIVPLTRSLKLAISEWAVSIVAIMGFDVQNNGASLFIDSYELVVAAACSGLNSLVSLLAVGLFYAYLRHRAHPPYALMLAVLMVPVAIVTNLLRVVLLLLATHFFGSVVVESSLHEAAGFLVFVMALTLLLIVDFGLARVWGIRDRQMQA